MIKLSIELYNQYKTRDKSARRHRKCLVAFRGSSIAAAPVPTVWAGLARPCGDICHDHSAQPLLHHLLQSQGTQRVPSWEQHWFQFSIIQHLLRNYFLIHNNLKDKLFEPVRSHQKISLLPPILSP